MFGHDDDDDIFGFSTTRGCWLTLGDEQAQRSHAAAHAPALQDTRLWRAANVFFCFDDCMKYYIARTQTVMHIVLSPQMGACVCGFVNNITPNAE